MPLYAIAIGAVMLCNSPNSVCHLIPHQPIQTPLQQMIRMRIDNGVETADFIMEPDATGAELYSNAEFTGILEPLQRTVLLEYNGRIILNRLSNRMRSIAAPPRFPHLVVPRVLIYAFDVEQIEVMVHITDRAVTKSFMANAGMRTSEVYQKAVNIGIMQKHQLLRYRYRMEMDRVLENDISSSSDRRVLLDYIDPKNPNELRLIVSPIPEGVLLFAMFRDMTPNQDISLWNWAQFCIQNPWHGLCLSLSQRLEFESNGNQYAALEMDPLSSTEVHVLANHISIVNIPTWSGVLHLEHTPPSVRAMTLKGESVRVNLEKLRLSSLTELTLDFKEIIGGFDFEALSGSSLKTVRLPCHAGSRDADVDEVLEILATMRRQGEIRLERIEFGNTRTDHNIIQYIPELQDYDYIHSSLDREYNTSS